MVDFPSEGYLMQLIVFTETLKWRQKKFVILDYTSMHWESHHYALSVDNSQSKF